MMCQWCGQTDEKDITRWFQDPEGLWWHKGCREEFLNRIDEQTTKESPHAHRNDPRSRT